MAVRPDGLTPAPDPAPAWARPPAAWALTVLASMLVIALFGVQAWHRHHAGAAGLLAFGGIDPATPGPNGFVIVNPRHGAPAAEAGLRRGDRVLVVDAIPASDDTRLAARIARVRRGDALPIEYVRRTAHPPASEQVDILLATVTAFAAGELGDDATMLVVETG